MKRHKVKPHAVIVKRMRCDGYLVITKQYGSRRPMNRAATVSAEALALFVSVGDNDRCPLHKTERPRFGRAQFSRCANGLGICSRAIHWLSKQGLNCLYGQGDPVPTLKCVSPIRIKWSCLSGIGGTIRPSTQSIGRGNDGCRPADRP